LAKSRWRIPTTIAAGELRPRSSRPSQLNPPFEYGHGNHANYVHYLEAARIEALETVGSPQATRRHGYIIVAADLSVKYHSPEYSGETLDIVGHL